MRPEESARCLRWVLRGAGAVLLLAFATIFLPAEWMSATHAWLGLGTFPRSPLVEYLTRSLSALYAVKGGLYLVLSTDVVRYAAVISYVGWSTIAFGAGMVIVDTHAGMPWFWTILEGPPIAGMGLTLLWLRRRLGRGPR